MKNAAVLCSVALTAGSLLALPPSQKETQSHFTLTVSGAVLASFSGIGPVSYARRRSAIGSRGERLAIKLRADSLLGKLDFDVTPDVTGKPPFSEKGRYDIGNLGASGTILRSNKMQSWVNAKTGELVIEECDERHVQGHLDFKGPCRTGPEPGACSVHADFDVTRQR